MTGGTLVDVAVDDVGAIFPRLCAATAARLRRVVDEDRARRWAAGVVAGKRAWNADFGGAQHSLGRVWYTHLEEGKVADYFANRAASDELVERHCPGLQRTMFELARRVVGGNVTPRPGFCGPGVHVFSPRTAVAETGGDVHFDTEGLSPDDLAARVPAATLVLMLAPPACGGALRVWDVTWEGSDLWDEGDLDAPHVDCAYGEGDLVVLDSYRMHQIQPFFGDRPRISATCHVALRDVGWELWF